MGKGVEKNNEPRRGERNPGSGNDFSMTIQYFEDTDTLYIVLKNSAVAETRDLDENTLIEFDAKGGLVAMTIEHARERAELPDFSFQRVAAGAPA